MGRSTSIWLSIHSYVSMFFLPLAVMYAVTGAISLNEERHGPRGPFPPGAPMARESATAQPVPGGEMGRPEGAMPEGDEEAMENEGPRREGPSGVLGKLVVFHKGLGGIAAKILGLSFAVALLAIYLSGIWIGWCNTKRRRGMVVAGILGLVVIAATIAFGPSAGP